MSDFIERIVDEDGFPFRASPSYGFAGDVD